MPVCPQPSRSNGHEPRCGEGLLQSAGGTGTVRRSTPAGSLGAAFLDEYEAWEKQVRAFPRSCPEIAPGIRSGFLPRFKFHITYQLRGDTISTRCCVV